MSAELIAILAVGVAVAGIGINGQRAARQDIKELRAEVGKRIDDLGERLDKRIDDLRQEMKQDIGELRANIDKRLDGLDGRLRAVEHGMAKLEGLLEGLREAIAGRKDAA